MRSTYNFTFCSGRKHCGTVNKPDTGSCFIQLELRDTHQHMHNCSLLGFKAAWRDSFLWWLRHHLRFYMKFPHWGCQPTFCTEISEWGTVNWWEKTTKTNKTVVELKRKTPKCQINFESSQTSCRQEKVEGKLCSDSRLFFLLLHKFLPMNCLCIISNMLVIWFQSNQTEDVNYSCSYYKCTVFHLNLTSSTFNWTNKYIFF